MQRIIKSLILIITTISITSAQTYFLKSVVLDAGGKKTTSSGYISNLSFGQPFASNVISSSSYRAVLGFWHPPYGGPYPPGFEEQDLLNPLPFPIVFSLSQNYPNPFNHQTVIRYSLPVETEVNLKVINTAGRVISTLVSEKQKPGVYNVTWNLKGVSQSQLANGIYFYRLKAGEFTATKKMVMLR
jgi:hypothetical protein